MFQLKRILPEKRINTNNEYWVSFLKDYYHVDTVLRAKITDRVQPGVVYTTFHHPVSGANVITTDNSDWATNCPEFKVTAVQVTKVTQPSEWQEKYQEFSEKQIKFAKKNEAQVD